MMTEKQKQHRYDLCTRYLSEISKADSLMGLFDIHKRMWAEGVRHANIGPNEFGMFRTNDITSMKPSEVFLGNVYGLWTAPLNEWIGTKDEHIIREQYRNHLSSNVDWLRSLVFDNGLDRAKIERTIAADAPDWAKITDVRIADKEMKVDKLLEFTYKANGVPGRSNAILMTILPKTDMLLVPKNWHRGEYVGNIYRIDRIGQWKDLGYKDRLVSLKKDLLGKGITVKPVNEEMANKQQPRLKR